MAQPRHFGVTPICAPDPKTALYPWGHGPKKESRLTAALVQIRIRPLRPYAARARAPATPA